MVHEQGKRLALALFAALILTACQFPGQASTCNAIIDWTNFIKVGSTVYLASPQAPATLQVSDLGPIYAHVKFKVDGSVCDPHYQLKDGDAAFLAPNTAIYQVNTYLPTQALAAYFNGQLLLYQAMPPSP